MKRRTAAAVALATAGLSILAGSAAAADAGSVTGGQSQEQMDLARVRQLSARYHNVEAAIADGYVPAEHCVPAMGFHYVKPEHISDGVIDPMKPEMLLFAPSEDGVKLAGVEYLKFDADQDLSTDDDRPSVLGEPFDGPMPGHEPGMPVHYDKHVWLWEYNPAGLFAPFNERLSCGFAEASS